MIKKFKKRNLLALCLSLLLFVAIFATIPFGKVAANADVTTEPDLSMFTFLKNSDSEGYYYSIRLKNKTLANVTIPKTYLGLPVKEIGMNGFSNSNLDSIHIPDSVKIIGSNAFAGNANLRYVTMEKVETIGTTAFANCISLNDIVFPKSVNTVGASAFKFSEPTVHVEKSEEEITSWNNWLADFNGDVVYGVESLIGTLTKDETGYEIIQSTIYAPQVSLFLDYYNEVLEYRVNPYNVTGELLSGSKPIKVITANSLIGTALDYLAIGRYSNHDIKIESGAFLSAEINEVWLGNNVSFITTAESGIEEPATGVFADSLIRKIELPNTMTKIPAAMFQYCYGLTSVTFHGSAPNIIPNYITEIGAEAFLYCESMPSINIPESVITIGSNAFSGWGDETVKVWFDENDSVPNGWDSLWCDSQLIYTSPAAQNVIVYYVLIEGSGYIIDRESYTPGTTHLLKNLTNENGYATFSGWYLNPNLIGSGQTGNALTILSTVSGEIWLAASVTLVKYDLKMFLNGKLVQSTKYTIMNSITLLRPSGYSFFNGWYDNSALTGTRVDNYISSGSTGNRSYYAEANNDYNLNGGGGIIFPPPPVIPPDTPYFPPFDPILPPITGPYPPGFPPIGGTWSSKNSVNSTSTLDFYLCNYENI